MGKSWSQSVWIPDPPLTEKNVPDQSGKVFIITGGNSGVGLHLARILYGANAIIYLACRSEIRAAEAMQLLRAEMPNSKGSLTWLPLDLADLCSIKPAVAQFLLKETRLDVLWNNAGVMFTPDGSNTKQEYDLQIGTNVLGPYLFTKLLYTVLKQTADKAPLNSVRICWASSVTIEMSPPGGLEMDEFGAPILPKNRLIRYAISKAANNLLASEFGKRWRNDNLLSVAVNPGNLNTELTRHFMLPFIGGIERWVQGIILSPPRYGAYTELYAGLSRDLTLEANSGGHIWPWGRMGYLRPDIQSSLCTEEDGGTGKAAKLWEWCQKETQRFA